MTVDTTETLEMSVEQTYAAEDLPPKSGSSGISTYNAYAPPFSEGLSEGTVSVSISVADHLGNEAHQVWQFLVDKSAPVGSVLVNDGDSETFLTLVTLRVEAEWGELEAPVKDIKIRNDDLNFAMASWQPFIADEGPYVMHKKWVLSEEAGQRTVYVRLRDSAGNESSDTVIKDSITLVIHYPETFITSGPSGSVDEHDAAFTFYSSKVGSLFKTKLDNEPWSEWSSSQSVEYQGLKKGNHYFQVKAGKDSNNDSIIDPEEEDPIPATRSWVITPSSQTDEKEDKPFRLYRRE